ncbi:MAG: DUF4013 domain-containing protein [Acidobacteriia bacterium]|nr:DUF4013 domain-containing protein [Terriglobia bacterium]
MNSEQIKAILFFPIRDSYSRKQLLIASLIMLAGTIIPLIPIFFLMGYAARIARQIVLEKKEPSMTEWDNWSEFFVDGARIFGIQVVGSEIRSQLLGLLGQLFERLFVSRHFRSEALRLRDPIAADPLALDEARSERGDLLRESP